MQSAVKLNVWYPMQVDSCCNAAAEYIRRKHTLARIGKVVLPLGGELLFLNRILTARRHNNPVVLCYHGIVPDEIANSPLRECNLVGLSEFSEQMSLIARTMTPISLSELESWHHGDSTLPRNPVLITFDDGYRNNLIHAAAVLLKYSIPAVIFSTVEYLGTDRMLWPTEVYRSILLWPSAKVPLPDGSSILIRPDDLQKRIALAEWVREFCKTLSEELKETYLLHLHEAALPVLTPNEMEMFRFLSWEETRQLHRMGFTIGSHTMNHHILTRISADHLRKELEESKQQIEKHLNTSCISLAYPNGSPEDYSPEVCSEVAQAGYKLGFTSNAGTCSRQTDPLALNRICIPGKLSRLDYQCRISGLHDLLKSPFTQLSGSIGLPRNSNTNEYGRSKSTLSGASLYRTETDKSKLQAARSEHTGPRMNL
jgi:peptidoglycan/xylan/chitin deacetylase (PgdA/CDA1 family)